MPCLAHDDNATPAAFRERYRRLSNPFPDLTEVPLHLPVPLLTGAALLTLARVVRAGAATDAEIQATI